jgi:hypothetical protein
LKPGRTRRARSLKELDGLIGERQRWHPPGHLACDTDLLTAGGENREARAAAQQFDNELAARAEQVLAVIEQQQHQPVGEEAQQRLHRGAARLIGQAECSRDGDRDDGRIRDRREVDVPDTVVEFAARFCRDFDGEPRLAGPARTGEGHQSTVGQELAHLVDLGATADEAGELCRKVMASNGIGSAQRRELV